LHKIIPAFLAVSMLYAVDSNGQQWEINIKGTGPFPNIETVRPHDPTPLPTPLPPAPVVTPTTDNTPFQWPVDSGPQQGDDASARYFDLCPSHGSCYASLPEYANPLANSHRFACYTPLGMRFRGMTSVGGYKLYVPVNLQPSLIRTLCAGGTL